MELTRCGFEVYSTAVDDRGICENLAFHREYASGTMFPNSRGLRLRWELAFWLCTLQNNGARPRIPAWQLPLSFRTWAGKPATGFWVTCRRWRPFAEVDGRCEMRL